jgi:uncharacterized protein YukJ
MGRQKILLGVLSAVVVLAALVFVLQHQNAKNADTMMNNKMKQAEAPKPLPTTVDGVAAEIESEAKLDEAALDAEVTAETEEIQTDSETLNNLSESYDEKSL